MKPIETVYKGYRFRSRLEARWAVFFDAMGIKWEYEKEGYVLDDKTLYLPDFWLPESKAFVEVKPEALSDIEINKCEQLAKEFSVILAVGMPEPKAYTRLSWDEGEIITCRECDCDPMDVAFDCNKKICNKNHIQKGYARIMFIYFYYHHGEIGNFEWTHSIYYDEPPEEAEYPQELELACIKAKQARFEYGEW